MQRRVCESCHHELGNTAYYRHRNDRSGSVCPAKARPEHRTPSSKPSTSSSISPSNHSVDDFSLDCGDSESDSSVDSESTEHSHGNEDDDDGNEMNEKVYDSDTTSSQSSISESAAESSGCEVWDLDSEDDDILDDDITEPSNSSHNVIPGIVLFLNFFHVCYRLSDRAIISLMKFLNILFSYLARICHYPVLLNIARGIPGTIYMLRKYFKPSYKTYVVCPKCSTLYEVRDCIILKGTREESKTCDFIKFPNHPHISKRSKCSAVLMKKIKVGSKFKFVPKKSFVYCSIINSLKTLCKRYEFLQACEHWRNRIPTSTLGDVYDGKVWDDFQTINGRPYLSVPYNLCLGLNIDWFNPYKDTQYSVGAIYLTILNLPRTERYKIENILLVGMLPGPNEPSDMNSFLCPLVEELNCLYEGIMVKTPSSLISLTSVRAILISIMCDLPATRKICGFANFNARKGCSKCLKEFPTESFGAKPDYSGFTPDNWVHRDLSTHKIKANSTRFASTASEKKSIEKSYGIKYSELLNLAYLDIIRHHVVDPMHNIFLGIAKHAFTTWKNLEVIGAHDYEIIQQKVDSLNPPPKVGRIPRKITSGFSSLTANEWKNWILIYSLYALHGVLPKVNYDVWTCFVESCRIFTLPIITHEQIEKAHSLLVEYCQRFEELYGPESCSPNMHMGCHLRECMIDYGPFSSFWCFAFERFNGTLEGIKMSWNCPEQQMFTKFLQLQNLYNFQKTGSPEAKDFSSIICRNITFNQEVNITDSFNLTSIPDEITRQQIPNFDCKVTNIDAEQKPFHTLVAPIKEKCFTDLEFFLLNEMYKVLYPNSNICQISRWYIQTKQIVVNGEEFISANSRSQRSCTIVARWPGITNIDSSGEAAIRVGFITRFISHEICIQDPLHNSKTKSKQLLAHVDWYMDHLHRNILHESITIAATVFDVDSPASFIPVSRIAARCATVNTKFEFNYGQDSVIVAIPMIKHYKN